MNYVRVLIVCLCLVTIGLLIFNKKEQKEQKEETKKELVKVKNTDTLPRTISLFWGCRTGNDLIKRDLIDNYGVIVELKRYNISLHSPLFYDEQGNHRVFKHNECFGMEKE